MAQDISDKDLQSQENAPGLAINAQYIKDLSFENPAPIENLLKQDEEASTLVNIEVGCTPLYEGTFEVVLGVKSHIQRQDKTVYLVELAYAGVFTLSGIPEELLRFVLFVECPRLLFPFVRNLVAQITQESGFPPLYLKPVDFASLLEQRLQEESLTSGDTEGNA